MTREISYEALISITKRFLVPDMVTAWTEHWGAKITRPLSEGGVEFTKGAWQPIDLEHVKRTFDSHLEMTPNDVMRLLTIKVGAANYEMYEHVGNPSQVSRLKVNHFYPIDGHPELSFNVRFNP